MSYKQFTTTTKSIKIQNFSEMAIEHILIKSTMISTKSGLFKFFYIM